jgi:hypothetical protein
MVLAILRAIMLTVLLVGCEGRVNGAATDPIIAQQSDSQGPDMPVQVYSAAGYELSLIERNDGCYIGFSGHGHHGELQTSLELTCRFVVSPEGEKIQQVLYEDIGNGTVIIFVGTSGMEPEFEMAPPVYCGTQSQGVILRDEGVLLSKRIGNGRKCNVGEDEKEFWLFSH